MRKTIILANAAVPIGPYSHAVVANGFVFVSGQGPINPETGEKPIGIHAQVRQTLENIKTILEGVGTSMENVVKVQAYLANLDHFKEYNDIYREFFPQNYPARTTIGAQLLDILVEIDCIAVLPGDDN